MSLFDILSWLLVVVVFIYQWPKIKSAFLTAIGSDKEMDVDKDPIIRMINKNMNDLNKKASDNLKKDPKMVKLFKDAGWEIGGERKNNSHNDIAREKTRKEIFTLKYGEVIALKLIHKEVWIDMNEEQLIESRNNPTHKEKEITKYSTKETWIYGNKISGSYFELENGKVIKIVDR